MRTPSSVEDKCDDSDKAKESPPALPRLKARRLQRAVGSIVVSVGRLLGACSAPD
jgi:hypothetical protein